MCNIQQILCLLRSVSFLPKNYLCDYSMLNARYVVGMNVDLIGQQTIKGKVCFAREERFLERMKGFRLYLVIGLGILAVAAAGGILLRESSSLADAAMAEYQIDKLSCGSCVNNIKSALADVPGVGSVDINLTSNRGRITYDPAEIDSKLIADKITAAGYPATLRLELGPDEYRSMQQEQAQLGQKYLAKIGDRLLSRAEFEQQVQQRSGGMIPAEQTDRLWQNVWKEVLQRELLLASAEKNNVIIQPGEVDLRVEELKKGHQGLEELVVKRYGSMEAFRNRIREDMIINRNVEDHVYAGVTDPRERQEKLQAWYADLKNKTEVVIYDQKLKAASQGGGGCGGGCCS